MLRCLFLTTLALTLSPQECQSQAAPNQPADPIATVERLSRSIANLKETFSLAASTIEKNALAIDRASEPEAVRRTIGEVRRSVRALIDLTNEDSDLIIQHHIAREQIDDKIKVLSQITSFPEKDRNFLISQWSSLRAEVDNSRHQVYSINHYLKHFARRVDDQGALFNEYLQLRLSGDGYKLMQALASEMRELLSKNSELISSIKIPGG
jgi:hypothetical protein